MNATLRELAGLPISLESAPGHTPRSSAVRLRAGVDVLSAGDLLYSPMQILYPDYCSSSKQQLEPSVIGQIQ